MIVVQLYCWRAETSPTFQCHSCSIHVHVATRALMIVVQLYCWRAETSPPPTFQCHSCSIHVHVATRALMIVVQPYCWRAETPPPPPHFPLPSSVVAMGVQKCLQSHSIAINRPGLRLIVHNHKRLHTIAYYLCMTAMNTLTPPSPPFQGSHSTKIIGVTRLLKNIEMGDPGAKSLVFSSWLEVLDLIALALRDNSIKYSFLKTKKTFQVHSWVSNPLWGHSQAALTHVQ